MMSSRSNGPRSRTRVKKTALTSAPRKYIARHHAVNDFQGEPPPECQPDHEQHPEQGVVGGQDGPLQARSHALGGQLV